MKDYILIASLIISSISPFIAIYSIIKGSFRPQRVTRLLVLINMSVFVASLFLEKSTSSLYLSIVQWIMALILFVLSIKYGMGGKSKSDLLVFTLAIITILIWKITSNNLVTIMLSILVDIITFIPSIIKAWKYPKTEDWKYYFCDVVAGFLLLISLSDFSISNYIFPLYIFLINAILVLIIKLRAFKFE